MTGGEDDERTVFNPPPAGESGGGFAPLGGTPASPPAPPTSARPSDAFPPPPPPPAPPPAAARIGQIAVGDVLNGIYRITRFIARGGMGEVYEGVNIHSAGERVAVKVMLANLASDELVMAMFAKEAATLTRLHHEAIVPYRLAARDPQGRPFIVTEYVDGPSLEQRLGSVRLADEQFGELARRLARGLGAAHALGAIHRDIAPDNILLVDGDPLRPKIIDFGIARDAREQQQTGTIVGDGFAGKLKYVAPEQLGEYGRNIGPWTDLYSLALTLLAVASGRHTDMGGSIADAVRKRMSVPDLSAVPARYQGAFERALQPDPARRPQSMGDFITLLYEAENGAGGGFAPLEERPTTQRPAAPVRGKGLGEKLAALPGAIAHKLPAGLPGGKWAALAAAGGLVLVLGIVGIVLATGGDAESAPKARTEQATPGAPSVVEPGSQEFATLAASLAAAPPCAWLSFDGADASTVRFVGGAANPAGAQTAIADGLAARGAGNISLDMGEVVTFNPAMCGGVDALREFRAPEDLVTSPQRTYEAEQPEGSTDGLVAKPLVRIGGLMPGEQIVLLGIEAQGGMTTLANNRADVEVLVEAMEGSATGDGFELPWATTLVKRPRESYGIAVVAGPGPFTASLFGNARADRAALQLDARWVEQFRSEARAKGWRTDIFWFSVTDEVPG